MKNVPRNRECESGWTLLEVTISMMILSIGVLSFLMALTSSMRLAAASHENDVAANAARQMIERMRAATFSNVFALYNSDPDDDPGGAGSAPGPNFSVVGLTPLAGDVDGMAGEIIFPMVGSELREDVVQTEFGLSADLDMDGDGTRGDTDNHAADYIVLPVTIRLEWQGVAGDWIIEMRTLLTER